MAHHQSSNTFKKLRKRHLFEKVFRASGLAAIIFSLSLLAILLIAIFTEGASSFMRTEMRIEVNLEQIPLPLTRQQAHQINWQGIVKKAIYNSIPNATGRRDKKLATRLISSGAGYELKNIVLKSPELIGTRVNVLLPASSNVDLLMKGILSSNVAEELRPLNDLQITWINDLITQQKLITKFNWSFFTNGDSRLPELAGIWGGLVGSFWMLSITFLLSFPLGVFSAIYLEEYAKPGRWSNIIEININNLAAVPSIVFGLLGLSLFLNIFNMPRSAPITGAFVLTLMTLPTIIIAARAAIKAVPSSIREAALGLGASHTQTVMHHVIPLALPGTLTGTIIGMAQALGETAPLLMIGMVAFILEPSLLPTDASSALPVQIFLWADNPERGFVEKTAGAIIVLLVFLIVMNLAAAILRKKTERTW